MLNRNLLIICFFCILSFVYSINISNCTELQNINNQLSSQFILTNDINCNTIPNFQPIGNTSFPFKGYLDGQGYSIFNLNINRASSDVGLFSRGSYCTVSNLILIDFTITNGNGSNVGALFGSIFNSTLLNLKITTNLTSQNLVNSTETSLDVFSFGALVK